MNVQQNVARQDGSGGASSSRSRPRKHRRGVAVVLVLGLLAMTLALSYSMLRSQSMTGQLQRNLERTADARYAAQAGMNAALRKMHEVSWVGVDSPFHGKIDDSTGYDITYITGDASLTPSSPDWNEYPFRVTVRVVGYAENPDVPGVRSTHVLETVVQLSRLALNSTPGGWSNIQPYALYQWSTEDQQLEIPFRVEGNALMLGRLRLADNYPPSNERSRYFSDLALMRLLGLGDHRPFGGTVTLNTSRQTSSLLNALQNQLGNTVQNTNASSTQPVAPPSTAISYRLYPGGKAYEIPSLQATYGLLMQNASAAPDPVNNPLGVFRSDGLMNFGNNAKVTGTIISPGASSDIALVGTGVELRGHNLPPLEGSSQITQLPTLIVRDDFRVYDASSSVIQGLALVADETEIADGSLAVVFNLTGKLVTRNLVIGERSEWDSLNPAQWASSLSSFLSQLFSLNVGRILFYPQWMQQQAGLSYQPRLTVKPNTDGVQYHWQDWSQPIYVKAAADSGLRWNIVSQRTIAE
jgi:hypothetical protein